MKVWLMAAVSTLAASIAHADDVRPIDESKPLTLRMQPDSESVYAPPAPANPDQGINEGGVHLDLTVNYMTDYVYRGIEVLEPPGYEDRPNLQFDGMLSFDLGRTPHPFVGL